MKKRKIIKIAAIIMTAVFLITGTAIAFANVQNQTETANEVVVPQAVLDAINTQAPTLYSENVGSYKNFIANSSIGTSIQTQIENLIIEGSNIKDILVIGLFLVDKYGTFSELETMLIAIQSGSSYEDIFTQFANENESFIPMEFESEYLEELLSIECINADHIMIADRISQKLNLEFETIINKKIEGDDFTAICAEYGILNGSNEIVRVPILENEVNTLIFTTELSEEKIVNAIVIANKINVEKEIVLNMIKNQISEEIILATLLNEKY